MIRDYGANYYYVKSRRSKKRIIFPYIVFVFLFAAISFLIFNNFRKETNNKQEVAGTAVKAVYPSPTQVLIEDKGLGRVVQNALSGTKGTYGIVIVNLKTEEFYFLNDHKTFESASLYKLWVMATVLDLIKQGKLNEKAILSENIDLLYQKFNLASPSAKAKITISINDALEKMITISDNTTALLLSSKIKLTNVKTFLNENGFTGSRVGAKDKLPVTTPYDVAIFLKKLYEGTLIDQPNSERMIELLKRQRLNSKIPKYLPDEIVIAHKTGELDEYTHDAGIVYSPTGDYIIVIMSESDEESRFLAEERIANLSFDVYKYFTSGN